MKEIQQEITPITNEDLFIILNHPNAHFDYPIHCHPEYEINLVMNTRGSRIVGDSTEDFGPLDLVMTGPYVPHVWKSPLKTNHVITIQFSGDLIDSGTGFLNSRACRDSSRRPLFWTFSTRWPRPTARCL